jgi:hypothetical protein
MSRKLVAAAVVALLTASVSQGQVIIDLLYTGAVHTTTSGAIFAQGTLGSGSGNYVDFVRIGGNDPTNEGYNTSGRPVPYDENTSGSFTYDVQLFELPVATIGVNGVTNKYVYFGLDANEKNNATDRYLSIDKIMMFVSPTGSLNCTIAQMSLYGGVKVWDMDINKLGGSADHVVVMDYNLSKGSGWSDMTVYVPVTALAGRNTNDYMYWYSSFGAYTGSYSNQTDWTVSDGQEQWALDPNASEYFTYVPEPGSVSLVFAGGILVRLLRNRRTARRG